MTHGAACKYSLERVLVLGSDSDQSEDDISEKESNVSSIDSIVEQMFLDGGDVTHDVK